MKIKVDPKQNRFANKFSQNVSIPINSLFVTQFEIIYLGEVINIFIVYTSMPRTGVFLKILLGHRLHAQFNLVVLKLACNSFQFDLSNSILCTY